MAKKSERATQLSTTQKAVLYARVSSKEQDKEGFSIPAQQKLLTEYAQQNKLVVEQEFVDVETAKLAGRASFGEMVRYLKAHPQIRIVSSRKPTGCTGISRITFVWMNSISRYIS